MLYVRHVHSSCIMYNFTISIFNNKIFFEIINKIKLFSKFKIKHYEDKDLCIKDTKNGAIFSIRSAAAKPFRAPRASVNTASLWNASRLMPQPGDLPSKIP